MSSIARARQQKYAMGREKKNDTREFPGRTWETSQDQSTLELEDNHENAQSNSYFYEETMSQRWVTPGGQIAS